MGQATVDLPDPLQQQPSNPTSNGATNGVAPLAPVDAAPVPPLNLGNTDDLLSELAADEIDRMLADSEGTASAPPAGAAGPSPFAELPRPPSLGASVHVAPPKHERRPDRATDELLSGLAAIDAGRKPAEAAPRAAVAANPVQPPIRTATQSPVAPASSSPIAPSESPAPAVAKPARADAAAATKVSQAALQASILDEAIAVDAGEALSNLEQQADAAPAPADDELAAALSGAPVDAATSVEPTLSERAALESVLNAAAVDAGVDDDQDVAASDFVAPTGAGLPIYLKPLAWLNAPILLLPGTLRDALGKVALLTLFNAVAVLLYVVIFRRPHH